MTITIHTYKNERTYKKVDLLQFEKGKLCIYQIGKAHPVRSIYQYDIKFYVIQEEE